MSLSFAHIQQAWHAQNPNLVDMLSLLATQTDSKPDAPIPEHELSFERFLDKILSTEFRNQHPEVQFAERVAMIATLEADEGVAPLAARYKIHLILVALWEDSLKGKNTYSRTILKQAIEALPLSYGVWKGLKRIYKEAENIHDYEIFGQIAAKVDAHRHDKTTHNGSDIAVSVATKTYMSLRAWRYLRNLGQQMPMGYIAAAVQVLASVDDTMQVGNPEQAKSWVLNHICFHNSLEYGVNRFHTQAPRKLFDAKGRAFADAWQRDSEPLIHLLAIAKNEAVRQFATDSLKHDFKIHLRDVSVSTLQYLSAGYAHSNARDELLVWLLENAPHLEKSKFRALGLHEVVLKLLHSHYFAAYTYAIGYAKSYAPVLPLTTLLLLAICDYKPVRSFAMETILSGDPVADIGVMGWGQLLDTDYHHDIASRQLSRHFTRHELTPDWFFERLTSHHRHSVSFAIHALPERYDATELGADYFIRIFGALDVSHYQDDVGHYQDNGAGLNDFERFDDSAERCMRFALDECRRLDFEHIHPEVWQILLLHPLAQHVIIQWINEEAIVAGTLDMSYWHALAYEPDWQSSLYIKYLQSPNGTHNTMTHKTLVNKQWQKGLVFNEELASIVRGWLADVRRFAPTQLGFDWLIRLASSEHSAYRAFAIGRINKGFLPADFIDFFTDTNPHANGHNANATVLVDVDLTGQRYLFTGKMQSMTRGDAERLVKAANGSISGTVTAKLDYLVIGDDGSPLYGSGRKGSKQLKAEALIASSAPLKIISETAFLQMLSGQVRQVSADDIQAGAQALWQMATGNPSAAISELAISYLSHHHEHLCMALTDRPVDPDAIIPAAFFSAERVIPLLSSNHHQLRAFGLVLSEYELANWQPTPELWLIMAESSHYDVTQLLKRALLDKPSSANRRYHVDAAQISRTMITAFIASKKRIARQLGITLLQRHRAFQDVQSLYILSQSTDKEVRYAAVTMLWQHYKARQSHRTEQNPKHRDNLPADFEQLLLLLRRGLFEIPSGRLGNSLEAHAHAKSTATKSTAKSRQDKGRSERRFTAPAPKVNADMPLRAISTSQAKLALIETFRDVGLANQDFAALIMPTLYTFTHSAGKMERQACLVAVTRLLHRYPELSAHLQPVASAETVS